MASFNIQFPDNKQADVVLYMSIALGYSTQVQSGQSMIPNPETRAQFCKRMIIEKMKALVLLGAKMEDAKTNPTSLQTSAASIDFT